MDIFDVIPILVLVIGAIALIYFEIKKRKNSAKNGLEDNEPTFSERLAFDSPLVQLYKTGQLQFPVVTAVIFVTLWVLFLLKPLLEADLDGREEFFYLTGSSINISSLTFAQWTHTGWDHLINNSLTLLIFGGVVEAWMGRKRYLIMYLVSGYFSLFFYTAFYAGQDVRVMGASANIAAVFGCYAVFRVVIWHPIYQKLTGSRERSLQLVTETVLYIYLVFGDDIEGIKNHQRGIAFLAHILGSISGIFFAALFLLSGGSVSWTAEKFKNVKTQRSKR